MRPTKDFTALQTLCVSNTVCALYVTISGAFITFNLFSNLVYRGEAWETKEAL